MLLSDYLLRSRKIIGGCKAEWQLKYPSRTFSNSDSSLEKYLELTESNQIIESICRLASLKQDTKNHPTNIESMIRAFDLKCFAPINSTRKSFSIDGLRVDLDETDFGYRLGEIELILDHQKMGSSDLDQARQKIASLTTKLGNFWCLIEF